MIFIFHVFFDLFMSVFYSSSSFVASKVSNKNKGSKKLESIGKEPKLLKVKKRNVQKNIQKLLRLSFSRSTILNQPLPISYIIGALNHDIEKGMEIFRINIPRKVTIFSFVSHNVNNRVLSNFFPLKFMKIFLFCIG